MSWIRRARASYKFHTEAERFGVGLAEIAVMNPHIKTMTVVVDRQEDGGTLLRIQELRP